jgi:hypothetical protein
LSRIRSGLAAITSLTYRLCRSLSFVAPPITVTPLNTTQPDALEALMAQVAGRYQARSAIAQGQDKSDSLGLQVNAGPDGEPAERQRLPELRRDRPEQLTVLGNPVNARSCHDQPSVRDEQPET